MLNKTRCPWVNLENPLYVEYHDKEWGKPVHKDIILFEFLILEGAQAGLSWETILNKRDNYRKLYAGFDPKKVARFSGQKIASLLKDPGIIRNKLKVASAVSNAKAFLEVQKEFGSFNKYIWGFVDDKPILNKIKRLKDYPSKTPLSDKISKDLKKRGFKFVGSTIVYAYMQAIGMVNDHSVDCFVSKKMQQKWWLYIIRCKDNSLYTGITNDVKKRFKDHQAQNHKTAKYLRGRAPLKLVYSQEVGTKSQALKAEIVVKKLSKEKKLQLIKHKLKVL